MCLARELYLRGNERTLDGPGDAAARCRPEVPPAQSEARVDGDECREGADESACGLGDGPQLGLLQRVGDGYEGVREEAKGHARQHHVREARTRVGNGGWLAQCEQDGLGSEDHACRKGAHKEEDDAAAAQVKAILQGRDAGAVRLRAQRCEAETHAEAERATHHIAVHPSYANGIIFRLLRRIPLAYENDRQPLGAAVQDFANNHRPRIRPELAEERQSGGASLAAVHDIGKDRPSFTRS